MTVEKFEKKIRHLDQEQVITGAISSLNRLLVDKGITHPGELQKYFLEWMQAKNLTKPKAAQGRPRERG